MRLCIIPSEHRSIADSAALRRDQLVHAAGHGLVDRLEHARRHRHDRAAHERLPLRHDAAALARLRVNRVTSSEATREPGTQRQHSYFNVSPRNEE